MVSRPSRKRIQAKSCCLVAHVTGLASVRASDATRPETNPSCLPVDSGKGRWWSGGLVGDHYGSTAGAKTKLVMHGSVDETPMSDALQYCQ